MNNNFDSLYVIVDMLGNKMGCLLDTGATSSILHTGRYLELPEDSRPQLEGKEGNLEVADGGRIASYGSAVFTLCVDGLEINQRFIVADIATPAILGFDFLKSNRCFLDASGACVWVNGKPVSCQARQDATSAFKVKLRETITIPPLSEMIVSAEIDGFASYTCAVVEPSDNLIKRKQVLIAKTVVDPSSQNIHLRVVNLQSQPVKLYKKTVAGICEPVEEVESAPSDKIFSISKSTEWPEHLTEVWDTVRESIPEEGQGDVHKLLLHHQHVFSRGKCDIGRTDLVQHKIPTGEAAPVRQHPRRLPWTKREDCTKEVERLLDMGLISPSVSPWASPVVMVKKKDNSWRFCIDYRRLNNVTKKDSYPLPRIDDTLDALGGSRWFSTLDLASGYWQVEMDPADSEKTAFCTSGGGLFQWNVLPFGLTSAGATFERLMERVLSGLHWETCLIYLDDVIIFAKDFATHMERLDAVLSRIAKAGLKVSPSKCQLFQRQVEFLGHIISETGIATSHSKTDAVQSWPIPKCVKEVRSFTGLCSYYRRFVKNFADIAKPLHKLMEKEAPFQWTDGCQEAFDNLKMALTSAPILSFPMQDKPFILDTDASGVGIGVVLSQIQDEVEHVIAYYSRTLSKEERRYCVTRRELLAVVEGLKYFHHYVYGVPTLVRSDHGALRWLLNFKNPEGQMARWLEVIGTYNIEIRHRAGRIHNNADALSRRPCNKCRHCELKDEQNSAAEEPVPKLRASRLKSSDPNNWIDGWTKEQIITWQTEDPIISTLLRWKQEGQRPAWADIKAEGSLVRSGWSLWPQLEIHDSILYRRCSIDGEPEEHLRLTAPRFIRGEILRHLHDSRISGHLGVRKTAFNVRRRFWWPGMSNDVERWCQECKACQLRNRRQGPRRHSMKHEPVGSPMERMAMDILSFPTMTSSGNTCVLVVCDYFTKWSEAFALANHQAMTVADVLVTEIFLRLGVPRVLHSDQGPEFRSELMQAIAHLLEIKTSKTAPYRPQSDGLVERCNRTLISMLSKVCNENKDDWDDHLPYVMCAYRSTIQESTGFSPNRIMLGRELTLPIDLMYDQQSNSAQPECSIEYVEWVKNAMQENFRQAKEHMGKAAERQKKYYDARTKDRRFTIGNWVLRFYRPLVNADKLNNAYTGPFLVIKCIGEVNYLIQRGPDSTPITVHVDDLKPYYGSDRLESWIIRNLPLDKAVQCGLPADTKGVITPDLSDEEVALQQGVTTPDLSDEEVALQQGVTTPDLSDEEVALQQGVTTPDLSDEEVALQQGVTTPDLSAEEMNPIVMADVSLEMSMPNPSMIDRCAVRKRRPPKRFGWGDD